jgi:hypothetical protein
MIGTSDVYEFLKLKPATAEAVAKRFGVSLDEAQNAIDTCKETLQDVIQVMRAGHALYGVEIERAPELNAMISAAEAYSKRFGLNVSIETPYAEYFFEPGRVYWLTMK